MTLRCRKPSPATVPKKACSSKKKKRVAELLSLGEKLERERRGWNEVETGLLEYIERKPDRFTRTSLVYPWFSLSLILTVRSRVLGSPDQSNASEAFGWSRSNLCLGLGLILPLNSFCFTFLLFWHYMLLFTSLFYLKNLVKIPQIFLYAFDVFLDIFVNVLHVKNWWKVNVMSLVIGFLSLLNSCDFFF